MAGKPARRRWLQFRLKSLLLLTVICAVALTWWRQWKQGAELTAMHEKLQRLEAESEYQHNVNRVLRGLDLENSQHRQAFKVLRYMSGGWLLNSCQQKPIGDLEVLLFHSDTFSIPGSVDSVAAVLRDYELIDLVVRESNTRVEWHDVEFQDTDGDGTVEVVFDCGPGMWSDSKPFTIVYKVLCRWNDAT
ncbi:MAG: hypothetical protein ACYTG0_28685 [Planctomycetota bacterium]